MRAVTSPLRRIPPETRSALLVAAVALLAFLPALRGGFVNWDDTWILLDNKWIRDFKHLPFLLNPFADRLAVGAEYLPLRDLTNVVDYHYFVYEPTGYRLGNWLLHGLGSVACWLFLREALGNGRAALAGALLWAVHPFHAEAVAWASARKDLLNAVLALTAATLLLRSARTGRRGWWWAALLCFVLATLSKTSAAALPLAVAVVETLRGDGAVPLLHRARRALLRASPFLLVAALGAALNAWHQSRNWVRADWRGDGPLEHLLLVGGVQARGMLQTVWPIHLSADYAVLEGEPFRPWNVAGLGAVLGAALGSLALVRRRREAGAMALWWFLVLVPVSNLLVPITNLSADRYLFLPLLGPCALGGMLLARVGAVRGPRVAGGALVAVAAALALLSARQALVWRDGLALWSHAVEVSPRCGRAWLNLGEARLLVAEDREGALAAYGRMVEVEPDNASLWVHLGNRLWELEGPERAAEVEAYLRRAVDRAPPDSGGPLVALGWIVNRRGRVQESIDLLQRAVERQPLLAEARGNLGRWHASEGRLARATEELEEALRIGLPVTDAIEVRDLLNDLYLKAGDPVSARRHRLERERLKALLRGD